MNPDKYQQAWHAHSSETRVSVDADLLLKQVQRNQRDFQATILRRDVVEVVVGLLLLPYWFYMGLTSPQPWTWWLTVPAIIWVIGFFVIDRRRHPQKPNDPGEPLVSCAKNSLTQVEHQIYLLRNVFWWYLLPFTFSILVFFAHVAWSISKNWFVALGIATPFFAFLLALYSFIDYINQRAVRKDLQPRRQELIELLRSLGADDSPEGDRPISQADSPQSTGVLKRWLIVTLLAFVTFIAMTLALGSRHTESSYNGPPQSSGQAGDSLAKLIVDERKENGLVGLAAMVMVDGQVEAAAVHGERKAGSGVPLELGDRWHLGGISKAVTATMIARLVESGQMKWTDTIGKIFPEAPVHDDWKPVTLVQLLTDTAGAPPNFPKEVRLQRPPLGPECTQARREAVLNLLADKPAYPAGTKNEYSNVGYTIAGAMAENVTGATWEDLVKREVFAPLKLADSGFGPPKSSDEMLEQPRGHRTLLSGKTPVDDKSDNTPIIGPAATIHMSLSDLCTFATEHLRGDRGTGKLLSRESYQLLHTPALNAYACGWVLKNPTDNLPYTVYWHNGSNTEWYALVMFIPEKNMVIALASNDGDSEKADAAMWRIVKATIKHATKPTDQTPERAGPSPAP